MSKSYVFYIDGMTCSGCSTSLETLLKKDCPHQIEYFYADITTAPPHKTIIVLKEDFKEVDLVRNQLIAAINKNEIGFSCRDANYMPHTSQTAKETSKKSLPQTIKKIISSHWFLGITGSLIGMALLITFLATGGLPLGVMIGLGCLSTVLTLALGANSYYDAWKKLRGKKLTMDSLFAISTLTILAVSIGSFFIPWLPMMFEAGLLIYGFRHLGLAIEETIKEKINPGCFQDRAPEKVRLVLKSSKQEIPLNYIKANDCIEVLPGEIIPLDGLCENETSIYTTILNGSPLPQHYRKNAEVLAGMRLADDAAPLKICVTKDASQSYLARLDEGILASIGIKAPLEEKTEKLLNYFIPAVIAIALISGITLSFFFPITIAIQSLVSVLVSACPCTLGLVIPLAVKMGTHKAAEHRIYFKNAQTLQEAEQIDTILFDVHGTLTEGIPRVKRYALHTPSKLRLEDFFSLCASLENTAKHPMAKAIHSYMQEFKPNIQPVPKLDIHHCGHIGFINDTQYAIGSSELMLQQGIDTQQLEKELNLEAGESVVYLAKEKELLGYLVMTDNLKKDAKKTIDRLKAMGKEIYLCTGADEATAQRYAKLLGIDKVYANCLATSLKEGDKSKPSLIKSLRAQNKKVAMVGDAANDAHAWADSHVGIAILSPNSDESTKNAGVVIHDSLELIVNIFELSKQTINNIHQNLWMSLSYNLGTLLVSGGLLLTLGLTVNPAIGAALMVVQACIILANVFRFKHQSLSHLGEKEEKSSANKSSFQQMQNCDNLRPASTLNKLVENSEKNPKHSRHLLKPIKKVTEEIEMDFIPRLINNKNTH